MTDIVLALTTLPVGHDAAALARDLVDRRLAACVTILPSVTSVYAWKGEAQIDAEQQLIVKTTASSVEALRERLRKLHPYEMPEFLVLPVADGSPDYLRWVSEGAG
jgi:periplasmic divalent cation tolerance protein